MSSTIPATAVDIYRMLPEGTRCEVLYNQLITTPAPNTNHQFVSVKLSALLYNYLEETGKGIILHAPTDVYFDQEQSVLQPDVLVILNQNKSIIHKDGIYGAPDVVFEILSGNRIHDTLKKKNLYEKAGVKEYFIVDPTDKKIVMFALNEFSQYELVYELTGKITSEVLGCSFNL